MKQLADVCSPATFGRNDEDVLDESYRRAWKLDRSNFATNFSPLDHEVIVNALRSELLEGYDEKKPVRAELYKLNIYGPGSFFKAHKDTPRAENMFGSLVVVYPTPTRAVLSFFATEARSGRSTRARSSRRTPSRAWPTRRSTETSSTKSPLSSRGIASP